MNKLIIIGSGPAGLTAGIYAARARLDPLILGGYKWGGQLMDTTVVENFPGFVDGIEGPTLMNNMIKQAERFGAQIVFEDVTGVDFSDAEKKVFVGDKQYQASSVIIATGSTPRRLGIKGEDEFYGRGVSTCATCDGAFYKDKIVAVVGGGDSAMEESTFLTRFTSKVYLIHRRNEFRASKIMQEKVLANPKIEVLYNTVVNEVVGENTVKSLSIETISDGRQAESKYLEVDGMFLTIGHIPVTKFFEGHVELNENGYIKSPDGVHTSKEGIFVAGDVEDYTYRQAITAAAGGCKAAMVAEKWLTISR